MKFTGPNTGTVRTTQEVDKYMVLNGAEYEIVITSDSGNPNDLDGITFNEIIEKKGDPTGMLIGNAFGIGNANGLSLAKLRADYIGVIDPITATSGADATLQVRKLKFDKFSSWATVLVPSGSFSTQQYFEFKDSRTGMTAATKIKNSGFEHTITITKTNETTVTMFVRKKPFANNQVEAGEMSEAAQRTVEIKIEKP